MRAACIFPALTEHFMTRVHVHWNKFMPTTHIIIMLLVLFLDCHVTGYRCSVTIRGEFCTEYWPLTRNFTGRIGSTYVKFFVSIKHTKGLYSMRCTAGACTPSRGEFSRMSKMLAERSTNNILPPSL